MDCTLDIDLSELIGKPFADRGRGPDGYDCWGLVIAVFARAGIALPDYPLSCRDAAAVGAMMIQESVRNPHWRELAGPVAPCVVLMSTRPRLCNHVGAYIGRGRMLHATGQTGVTVARLDAAVWQPKIRGYYQWTGK